MGGPTDVRLMNEPLGRRSPVRSSLDFARHAWFVCASCEPGYNCNAFLMLFCSNVTTTARAVGAKARHMFTFAWRKKKYSIVLKTRALAGTLARLRRVSEEAEFSGVLIVRLVLHRNRPSVFP